MITLKQIKEWIPVITFIFETYLPGADFSSLQILPLSENKIFDTTRKLCKDLDADSDAIQEMLDGEYEAFLICGKNGYALIIRQKYLKDPRTYSGAQSYFFKSVGRELARYFCLLNEFSSEDDEILHDKISSSSSAGDFFLQNMETAFEQMPSLNKNEDVIPAGDSSNKPWQQELFEACAIHIAYVFWSYFIVEAIPCNIEQWLHNTYQEENNVKKTVSFTVPELDAFTTVLLNTLMLGLTSHELMDEFTSAFGFEEEEEDQENTNFINLEALANYYNLIIIDETVDDYIGYMLNPANKEQVSRSLLAMLSRDENGDLVSGEDMDPTGIELMDEEFFDPLTEIEDTLRDQLEKDHYWEIDTDFLIELGTSLMTLAYIHFAHENGEIQDDGTCDALEDPSMEALWNTLDDLTDQDTSEEFLKDLLIKTLSENKDAEDEGGPDFKDDSDPSSGEGEDKRPSGDNVLPFRFPIF